MATSLVQLNGKTAAANDLGRFVFAGFAHFTAMQVRNGVVRGLDLHLARLRNASQVMFGRQLDDDVVRGFLGRAVWEAGRPDASLTAFVASRPGEFERANAESELDVVVKVADPATPPVGPYALDVVEHERHLPQIKHVGEVSKTLLLRRANANGFDDAAFVDRSGRLTEATIWNLAFWDGRTVLWPEGQYLLGVTMQILQRQLIEAGLPQETRAIWESELDPVLSAVVMNSWTPGIRVSRIGSVQLDHDVRFAELLRDAYMAERAMKLL